LTQLLFGLAEFALQLLQLVLQTADLLFDRLDPVGRRALRQGASGGGYGAQGDQQAAVYHATMTLKLHSAAPRPKVDLALLSLWT
jgi:hypothetical protein